MSIDHYRIRDHFVQFANCLGASTACRSFLQLLWLLSVWLVWNEHNSRLFYSSHTPNVELGEKVKFHSYRWLKANNATFVFGCQQWSDPLACLVSADCLSLYLFRLNLYFWVPSLIRLVLERRLFRCKYIYHFCFFKKKPIC